MRTKPILLFICFFLATTWLKAAVVYVNPNPDITYSNNGPQPPGIDLNNDGSPDMEFRLDFQGLPGMPNPDYFYHAGGIGIGSQGVMDAALGQNPFGAFYWRILPMGTPIGPATAGFQPSTNFPEPVFGDQSSGQGNANIINQGDCIIGLQFMAAGNAHYAWIRVNITGNTSNLIPNIVKDWAYESIPNTAINAGDTGSSVSAIPVTSITVNGQNNATTITSPNGMLQMNAVVLPANATNQTVAWSVMNGTGNASISATGMLTAMADGTVTVVATANDGSNVSGQQVITISNQPPVQVASITVNGQNNATQITTKNGTLQMIATVLPANASNSSVIWSVTSVTGAATINSTGLLTAVGNGIVKVVATANDGSNVSGSTNITISNQATVPVPITSITVSGQGNASAVATTGTLQMLAAVLPANASDKSVTWSVTNGTTGSATIDTNGLLTALTDGIVLVRAKARDGSNVEGTKTITISGNVTAIADIFKGRLDLYPNPANASIHLKFEEPTRVNTVTVYSLSGSIVLDKVINGSVSDFELDTDHLTPGNYFLKVLTGDGSVALLKFSKQ